MAYIVRGTYITYTIFFAGKEIKRDMNTLTLDNLDYKLSGKQKALLEVIADPVNVNLGVREKSAKAGISPVTYYACLKNPNFVQALRIRGLSESLSLSIPIIKRMAKDALGGKYMQQKTMLEMSGHLSQQPLINILINNQADTQSEADLDRKIMEKVMGISTNPVKNEIIDVESLPKP
jgi:hypothetical protein